jgi:hypothetical protein
MEIRSDKPPSCQLSKSSSNYLKGALVYLNLQKYSSTIEEYNTKVINDIVFDERKRIVSLFKDYLLLDENNDFLKR